MIGHAALPARRESLKSIGYLGSFALITNNLAGPSMMGLPNVFLRAGYLPSILCILYVWASSSICGTLLAETIASIPGNSRYEHDIEFSVAFHYFLGDRWGVLAESLFLLSCMSQAMAAIVVTAHTLDGFMASFLFAEIYALQLWPSPQLISWSARSCHDSKESMFNRESASPEMAACTPFSNAGPLVLTGGFALVALLFFPLGTGHLKEAMGVQLLSFFTLLVLLAIFFGEFAMHGFAYSIPVVGSDQSDLAGIVLFNFAYIVAVPSWLNEKADHVCINKVIWNSSSLSALLYIAFSLMAACSFSSVNEDMLTVLTSPKVHFFTRSCAALFGVLIIGCGVPIYCIIMKNTLLACGVASKRTSFIVGACVPYLLSWALYQGEFLLNLLNYSGLIVNGLVAFILPLLLTLQATRLFKSRASNTPPLGPPQPCLEGTYLLAEQEHTDPPHDSDGHDNGNGEEFARLVPLPAFLVPHRTEIIIVIIASYIAIILSTIVSNAVDFFENYF